MRVSNWNPQKYDGEFMNASMDRLRKAAELIKNNTKSKLQNQIGKGKTTGISHGPYKRAYSKGRYHYTGEPWTARVFGSLLKTIRVVEKHEAGSQIAKLRNIRVYAGNYMVWWAKIFEYYRPYMRPALNQSKNEVRNILENG